MLKSRVSLFTRETSAGGWGVLKSFMAEILGANFRVASRENQFQ